MKLSVFKKYFLASGLILLIVAPQIITPAVSHAQATSTVDFQQIINNTHPGENGVCSYTSPTTWPGCILLALTYPTGLFVAATAWLIQWGLLINQDLAYTEMVGGGFEVTRNIANLGFVFAIIVIAIATIIGYESYGMKKNLWKLIVAALLVNFSLVICAVIISFFDQFAYYFADQMGGHGIGHSGVSLALANMFQLNTLAGWTLSTPVSFLAVLIAILVAQLLIGITMAAVALTLIVRFFYIIILMILMPFAWLAWVVPGMEKHWRSWWERFIQWVISPAILLGFVYIALAVMSSVDSTGVLTRWNASSLEYGPGSVIQKVSEQPSGSPGLIETMTKMFVGLALMWGAIIAANSAGAKGADTAMSWGKKAGTRAKMYGKRAATYPLRREGGRNFTERLQTLGNKSNGALRFISSPLRYAGNKLSDARQVGEKTLEEAEKQFKGMSTLEQARRFGSISLADQASKYVVLNNINKEIKGAEKKVKDAEKKGKNSEEYQAALKELAKAQSLLKLLPTWAAKDITRYQELEKSGIVGKEQLKRDETRVGKLFVLYGEHEKKHDKGELDKIREIVNKKEEGHGDDHAGGGSKEKKEEAHEEHKEEKKSEEPTHHEGGH